MKNSFYDYFDYYIPVVRCELNYNKDYELLIAIILSSQCTDKRVNEVTKVLFSKYDLESLSKEDIKVIEKIIHPCGMSKKKSLFIKEVATRLINDYNGKVPNNKEYLETLPGVGRKTANVFISEYYQEAAIAVDTHVKRVSTRLNLADEADNVLEVEKKLMKYFPKDKWAKTHLQLVLFGRYICKSQKPLCEKCPFTNNCKKHSS